MQKKIKFNSNIRTLLSTFLIALILSGCSTIKLVGDYDEQIDKGTTNLQKEFETFMVNLESTAKKPEDKVATCADDESFYKNSLVTISGLRIRADAAERNSLTVRAFDKLRSNLLLFETMHRDKKEGLKRIEIDKLIRPGFTSQFTAILTFELAKRRGEKIDEVKTNADPTSIK